MQQQDVLIERWRGLGLILACFAVSLRLVVPAGFMPGVTADGRMGLVICGPQSASPHQQQPGEAPREQPCASAGVAAAPPVETASAVRTEAFLYAPVVFQTWRDLAPGRGLPAPPPPAIGPPLRDV